MPSGTRQHQDWLGRRPTVAHRRNGNPNITLSHLMKRILYLLWRWVLKWPAILIALLSLTVLTFTILTIFFTYLAIALDPYTSPILTLIGTALAHAMNDWVALSPKNLDLSQCKTRVDVLQAHLFDPELYYQQYTIRPWNLTLIPDYQASCAYGFVGNSDIYGLGIRLGLYLQWACSFTANCLSKDLRQTMVPANMLFAIALIAAIFRTTTQGACTFVVEIEIMLLLFMGCFMALRVWPNLSDPDNPPKRGAITWQMALSRLLYNIIIWYATWYWLRGYATNFVKMPCGTTHFILGLVSEGALFDLIRLYLGFSLGFAAVLLSAIIPVAAIAFAREIWTSIYDSAVVQGLYPHLTYELLPQTDGEEEQHSTSLWIRPWQLALSSCLRYLRRFTGIGHTVRPVSRQARRRYIAINLISSAIIFIYCVLGVELTIRSNDIMSVNTVDSVGQYVALTIGVGTMVVFIYGMLKEAVRKRTDTPAEQHQEQDPDPDPDPVSESTDIEMNQNYDLSQSYMSSREDIEAIHRDNQNPR